MAYVTTAFTIASSNRSAVGNVFGTYGDEHCRGRAYADMDLNYSLLSSSCNVSFLNVIIENLHE